MIIVLDVMPDLSIDYDAKLRVLENVLVSHGEGKHVLWMPVELVGQLLQLEGFTSYSKRVLFDLKSLVLETRALRTKFAFYAVISFDDATRLNFQNGRFEIGYRRAGDSAFFQLARLVTENLNDARIMKSGANISVVRDRDVSKICKVDFEFHPGGGSTTFDNFERIKGLGLLVMCILDSDKKHPADGLGDTARRFTRAGLDGCKENYFVEILRCQEIENIIPQEVVSEVFPNIDEFAIFNDKNLSEYRLFADHKRGLRLSDALDIDRRLGQRYWSALEAEEEDGWVCPPLGDNVLPRCLEYMESCCSHKLAREICSDNNQIWEALSNLVASWGVGLRRKTV